MTAPIISNLIRSGLSAATIKSMAGPNSAKWSEFVNKALGFGYGVGEILDFIQANEAPDKKRFREKIERKIDLGIAQPTDEAALPLRPSRPGQQLSQAAQRAAPLAAAMNLPGLFGRQQDAGIQNDGMSTSPPPPPIAPQSANAMPQNAQNRLAQMMKKARGKGPLSIESLTEQDQERRLSGMADRAASSLRASVADIAPTVFEQAQALVTRMSPEEASMQIRKSARKAPAIAKELARLRRERGIRLEDVIAQEFGQAQQEQLQGAGSADDVLRQLNELLDQM